MRILGAGPAGLAAALTLARAGRAVEVFERRGEVGGRFGGDLQALENWSDAEDVRDELRRMEIAPDFECHPFHAIVETNGRRSAALSFARPVIYVVKRGAVPGSLDQGLMRQALEAGAVMHFGRTLPPADADIVATGPVAGRVFAVAQGIVFDTAAADRAVGLLHDAAALKGYSYLVVVRGYGCLCTVMFDDFPGVHARFERAQAMLLERFAVPVANPRRVGGVGHFSNRNEFRRGRALYVGEAAGLQDLLWGFGIRIALRSGWLAARCLLDGRDYAREAAVQFVGRLKASIVNRLLWETFRVGDYALILAALKRNGLTRLRFFYRYNWLQRLLYPPARRILRRRYPDLRL